MTTALENMEGALYGAPLHGTIGDTFSYKASGGEFVEMQGFVDYGDMTRPIDGVEFISQDISVEVSKSLIPVKPDSTCRVQFAKVPGSLFKPVNVGRDESGNCWIFEVVKVNV